MPLRRLACVLVLATPAAGGAAAAGGPGLDWGPCPPAAEGAAPTGAFRCATATVPMDHARPDGPTVALAVIRAPARDPAARIGTLFWNPGGPGDSGTAYLPAAIGGFPDRVRDRFDIVSWDPRGMGGGTTPAVQCFDSAAAEAAFLDAHLSASLPATPAEVAADSAGRAALGAACVARTGDLLAHVSTADSARDLDLLRQAVGEDLLSYYGTSYGTYLGATYLNMFPDRVRAAVLDGAVTPSAWAGGPGQDLTLGTFLRIGSDFGGDATIRAFLDQCGAVASSACAFSAGSPEATRAKWHALLTRARGGLSLEGQRIDDRDILAYVGGSLYTVAPLPGFGRFPGWPAVAEFLEALSHAPAAGPASAAPAPEASPSLKPAPYNTSVGRQLAVICGESPNPATPEAFAAQIGASYVRAGYSAWPFVASCLGWTARAAAPYAGPWDRPSVPVLVIGNSFDPATPLSSSVGMVQELADARLLIVNGFGHTVLINPSRCAQERIAAYLIDGTLPPAGATCFQDRPPFPGD